MPGGILYEVMYIANLETYELCSSESNSIRIGHRWPLLKAFSISFSVLQRLYTWCLRWLEFHGPYSCSLSEFQVRRVRRY